MKADALFLTGILKNFRDVCMKYYALQPVYCDALPNFDFTVPNFASDAMVKLPCVEINLVYHQKMH